MHPMEAHRHAARIANEAVCDRFGVDHYHIDTPAHEHWLRVYDVAFARLLACNERWITEG